MNIKNKMQKFNQRWNVKSGESNEESFNKFKIRILNIFNNIDNRVTTDSISLFCQICGIQEKWEHGYMEDRARSRIIVDKFLDETNEVEFYKLLEILFCLEFPGYGKFPGYTEDTKESFYRRVCQAIELSDINLTTTVASDGEIIFYPKGEVLLDTELVNKVLSFLGGTSEIHFVEGLNFFKNKQWIKSAESMRRSLEEFLRIKLKNQTGLAANITILNKELKEVGNPAQIRKIIGQVFVYLDQYFNDNSKHNDGDISDDEAEFLIYQVALLMRYLNNCIVE